MPKHIQPEQIQLSNGIPVILQHYDGPVAATYWWIKTGSADEAPAEAGFAHFLEHMLFKDAAAKETGRASTGQMARAIESLGGDINAYTSFDQTVYHVTCASHHWERVIDAFGTMAKPQKFLKSDFDREREVILEELRKNEDSPGRQLFQGLFSSTFKRHPYGKPVIGYVKTLKAARVGQLEAFYRRNYVSGKMGLVLVGPMQDENRKKAIVKYLEKHFGKKVLPVRAAKPFARAHDAPLAKSDFPPFKVLPFDVKTPTLSISFRAPDLLDADTPALDLMAGILGMGELSRLYQRLFYQTSLATDASGGLYTPRDPGMLYFQAEVASMDKIHPTFEELFKELKRLRDEGPTDEELSRVIVNAESEKLYATQTADGMAGRLGFLKFILEDMDYDQKFIEELRAIDSAKIREVAARYLDPRRMSIVVMVPKDQARFDASEISQMARAILGEGVSAAVETKKSSRKALGPSAAPVEFFQLPSGMKVAYFERPQSHVFSVHASALGGLRLELAAPIGAADRDWGASNLISQVWTKGTSATSGSRALSAREISAIVEGSAAGMDGFSGRNSVGLQMTGLTRDWGKLSSLFSQVLSSPAFPKEEVDHARRVIEDAIRGIDDHTSQLCSKLFLETLYDHHPYGRMTYGSLESVGGLSSETLLAFHRQWMRPERMTIAVSGPIPRTALDSWLQELDDRVREASSGAAARPLPSSLADEVALKAPRWVERNLGREQTHILVGSLGTKIFADDRHALRLLQTLLGGQSGRLFIELREKKSLAYTVAPLSFEGLERGYVGTYIACAPNKKEEAIAGIKAVLERLAAKGPTAAEMSRAQEFFLGRRAMDMQSDSSIASNFGLETLYGVPHLNEKALVKKICSVSAREIQKVCRQYLVEPFTVTSIVG